MNIFTKYGLLLLSLLLFTAGTINGVSLWHHKRALTREALLRAESIAVNLSLVSAEAILTKNILQLVSLSMDATTRHENVVYAAVVDAKGIVLAHPDRSAVGKRFEFEDQGGMGDFGLQSDVRNGIGMGARIWDVSVPVKAKGSLVELGRAHVGIDQAVVSRSVRRGLLQLAFIAIACLALGLFVSFFAVRWMVRPLQELSRASARVGHGDFESKVAVKGQDEIAELSFNFNQMIDNLREAEARKREAARLESELEVAHGIQNDLLPKTPPAIAGLEMAFYCEPAKELGGDYYDWFKVGEGKLGFVVADVSGKGIPAALHMANLRNLFRFITPMNPSPLDVLKKINAMAYSDLKSEAFVTLVYGVLDLASGRLRYINAGHDPAFHVKKGGVIESRIATAFPVGAVDHDEFDPHAKEDELTLEHGDLFFLYTDGVTEAASRDGEQFGLERIQDRLPGRSPEGIVSILRSDLGIHLQGQAAQDDVTMLVLSRNDTHRRAA